MKKYINNKKYVSCDELARNFSNDYGVKVTMNDIHRLVDPYCRKRKGSLLQIDGEWFYDTATIYHLRCYGDNAVEFVKKIKTLALQQEKQTEDELEYNPNFDMDSVDKWYRPNSIKINESQYKRLFEGVEWNLENGIPNLHINHNMDDKSNKGEMSVDTRVFGTRNDILYGDETQNSRNKSVEQYALSRRAAISTYLNLIHFIKNGHKGTIFTDSNLDGVAKTTIEKWLKNETDENIVSKAIASIERLKFTSQTYMNLYDRVNNKTYQGNTDKIARYNVLTVPDTNVKCIALFTMSDFNFSDALKHGYLRQNGNTDTLLGISKQDRKLDDKGNLANIGITYDNNIKPNVKQNFSLNGFDIDNYNVTGLDHFKNSYQYQGGKYNTNEFGADDLQRELKKEKNYTSINQFLDKSIIYASYALNEEDFKPDFIISVPSSSQFNKYYCINLSNKLGCKYISDFFRKNLINVRWKGKDIYDEMLKNGIDEKSILGFENKVKGIAYNEIANQISKITLNFVNEYWEYFSTISTEKHGREKLTQTQVLYNFNKFVYESLKMETNFNDEIVKHLVTNFINQEVKYTDRHVFKSIVSLITLKIGKGVFNNLLKEVLVELLKYTNLLKENGYKLTFGNKPFKITSIDKRFRPYLNDIYIIADKYVSKKDGGLLTSMKNAKILIFDEDINSGASLKLCIDAFKEKIPEGNFRNLLCLTNAYSESGR